MSSDRVALKCGWIVKPDYGHAKERIFLSSVRKYRQEWSMVYITFENQQSETFTFQDEDKAGEFMIALDQHFGVGENESTIELKT